MEKTNFTELEKRTEQIQKKELDVRNTKQQFIKLLKKLELTSEGTTKETLIQYTDWHIGQIESGLIEFSSAKRSIELAQSLSDYCKNINELNTKEIENWWNEQLTRNIKQRTGGDNIKQGNKKLERGTKQKHRTQAGKFIKFILFLKNNQPLGFFDQRFIELPEQLKFLSRGEKKTKKFKQKPRPTQNQINDLINELRDRTVIGDATALMVSLANDTAARYSELASLQLKNLKIFPNYTEITFPQSKTIPRTVISALSKPLLLNWVNRLPNSHNKNTYLFSTKEGTLIAYENMRKKLKQALEKLEIEWKDSSAFHFLRHAFVSRASGWPMPYLYYWLGWHQQGMLEVYGSFDVEKCKPYYFKMLTEENNPMLDKTLSILSTQQKSQEDLTLQMIRDAVKEELAKTKH